MGKLVIPSIVAKSGGGGGGGSATWGDISGTLSNQTDLQNALDSKVNINNQNIKSYHAPSATLDATLGVMIPNVDACTEQGLYNVDYYFENDGATITSNALLEVSEASMSGLSAITQNLLINVGTELVYCTRNYMSNTFTSWSGKNIPAELAKSLQNTATGTGSVSILTNTTSANNIVAINANINNGINNGDVVIGKYCYTSSTGDNYNRVVIGNNSSATGNRSIAIGNQCSAIGNQNGCISIGAYSKTKGDGNAIAIGTGTSSSTNQHAEAKASNSIQLGNGTNAVENQFQVYTYPMLDGNTGKIPNERLRITVADTSSTSATIANVEGGKDYTFSQALTALSITAITSSFVEANIYFTADTGITVTLPQGTNTIGDFTFTAGKSYVISIQNGIAVRGELN